MKKNGYVSSKLLIEEKEALSKEYPGPFPFSCWENTLMYWYPKVKSTSIKTPQTLILKGEREDSGMPKFDIEDIRNVFSEIDDEIFIRGGLGSGSMNYISSEMDDSEIEEIIMENIFEIEIQSNLFLGELPSLVFRKYLDLDFMDTNNIKDRETHPHVRFFIRNGEIKASYNRVEAVSPQIIQNSEKFMENNIRKLRDWAREAANTFELPYSIDFIMDTNKEWYCIDMALDGLYWNTKHERWHEMSAHENNNEISNDSHNLSHVSEIDYGEVFKHP